MLHPFLNLSSDTVYGITRFLLFNLYAFSIRKLVREVTK